MWHDHKWRDQFNYKLSLSLSWAPPLSLPPTDYYLILVLVFSPRRSTFTAGPGSGRSSPTCRCRWPSSTGSTPRSASARSGRHRSSTKSTDTPSPGMCSSTRQRMVSSPKKSLRNILLYIINVVGTLIILNCKSVRRIRKSEKHTAVTRTWTLVSKAIELINVWGGLN